MTQGRGCAEYVHGVALDYLALGLDPAKAVFFRQSDVPEVLELAWQLSCVTGMGLLERAHSYKDKIARDFKPSVGLFYYPVLMAADILIYKPHFVPVGQDQIQHVEMTQDMAGYFNQTFKCSVFVRPEARMGHAPKVPKVDGEKMSKSYGNTIDLQMEPKELKKVIMSVKTDSLPVEAPKNPETCMYDLRALYSLFARRRSRKSRAGGALSRRRNGLRRRQEIVARKGRLVFCSLPRSAERNLRPSLNTWLTCCATAPNGRAKWRERPWKKRAQAHAG